MTEPSRRWILCCALLVTACGAGDDRLDPSDLELRDLLGIAPEVASAWDRDQRAAARQVIDAGLHQPPAPPSRAALDADPATDPATDRRVARALASLDGDRARHRAGALGVVDVAIGAGSVVATPRPAALAPHAPPLDLALRGWDEAGLGALPARGMDVLAELASDAGHRAGPVTVVPVPRLAVAAGYLPATASEPARLVVNPVVLAALEPPVAPPVQPAVAGAAAPVHAAATTAGAAGNPYSFYGSIAECAAAQRDRCTDCLAHGSCVAITDLHDGNAECTRLTAGNGRGEFLICINLALAIDTVAACAASHAPACPRNTQASASIGSLEANAEFLDDAACAAPLDACLAGLYGAPSGGFPGPGSDAGSSRPPRNTSVGCGDSLHDDPNCDAAPDCELDGPSCDAPYDGTCEDSNEQSGCSDTGGGDGGNAGGDSCSGDSGDSGSSCDGGGDSSCNSGDGGGCSGGDGGDCSGGGGGDCGGGGSDCNAAEPRGHAGAALPVAIAWALLPLPFATIARRRAERRRARAEADAEPDAEADAERGAAP